MSSGSRNGALVFGVILILFGLAFLFANWYSALTVGQILARYWPILPILIGVKKLYGYAAWREEEAPAGPVQKPARRRRPSLLGGLLWLALGVMFLLRNFGIGPDLWAFAGRYWPILLILLGLGKVIDYYRRKDGVSVRFGEVFGILLVFVIGSAIAKIPNSALGDIMMSPITIGGTDIHLGTSYGYTEEVSYPLPAGMALRIENSNGQVNVSPGSEQEVRVRLRKSVYESDESRAKEIAAEIKVQGGEEGKAEASVFILKTNRDELSAKDYRFKTDMDVFVPKQAQLEIRNPFGGVTVSGLESKLSIQSSHQPLEVHDCRGSFTVENRYGESRLTNLTGDLSVDARGSVTVDTVKGNVTVRDEYSPVKINNVEGTLSVHNTEGGNITVDRVTKEVTIEAPGTPVTVSNLDAGVKVTSSHRRIQVSDVAGNVVLASGYANALLKRIKGNVDVTSNSDRLSLEEIGGYLKTAAQGSSVRVNTVAGPVDISTTLKDVAVNGFGKGCKVTNEYGDVTLSASAFGNEEISVKDRNGDITLFLPPDAALQIDAVARNGRVTTDYAGLQPVEAGGQTTTLKGKLKSGGPRISLETDYSNISVRTREAEMVSKDRQ